MKQIRKLQKELLDMAEEAGDKHDTRYKAWAKTVTAVDQGQSNVYAFDGDFVNDGDIEIEIKPTVFLVCTIQGSRRYQTKYYNVVTMGADGTLSLADIRTTGIERGWALRIRNQIADLVESLGDAPKSDREKHLAILKERFTILSKDEIIDAALNLYEMHTRNK